MDNKGKLVALIIAGTLSLSGCGAQATEPVNTTKSPVSSEPATSSEPASSSESVSIGEVNHSKTTLSDLTENHLAIFQVAITGYPERIKSGSITIEQGDAEQNGYIEVMVMENELPENGESLFAEWKESTGYYAQFEGIEKQPEVTEPAENEPSTSNSNNSSQQSGNSNQQSGGSQSNQSSQPSGSTSSKPSGGTSTKPQPSTEQQQQQQEVGNTGEIFKPTPEQQREIEKSAGFEKEGTLNIDFDF